MCPLPTTVEIDVLRRYSRDTEATVYFCCLEALQNAAKHAGDDASVHIQVWEKDDELHFSVTDDGVGLDPAAARQSHGFVNMADRVGALDGSLNVDSAPGRGTSVNGSIPVAAVGP
jgi:signal transduction histidine kinase